MTQDPIIRMALEAELIQDFGESGTFLYNKHKLERFFNLAFEAGAKHERELCAKVCDEVEMRFGKDGDALEQYGANQCAASIRARNNKE